MANEDRTRAEWNQNEAVSKRVDELTSISVIVLRDLRYDSRKAADLLDCLRGIWSEVNAVASLDSNASQYEKEIAEVQALFNKLYKESDWEIRRFKFGKPRGASSEFLAGAYQLKDKLLILGQRLGFGMSTKRFSNYDDAGALRRASQ